MQRKIQSGKNHRKLGKLKKITRFWIGVDEWIKGNKSNENEKVAMKEIKQTRWKQAVREWTLMMKEYQLLHEAVR